MCIRQKHTHYSIRSESILSICVQGLARMTQPSSERHMHWWHFCVHTYAPRSRDHDPHRAGTALIHQKQSGNKTTLDSVAAFLLCGSSCSQTVPI